MLALGLILEAEAFDMIANLPPELNVDSVIEKLVVVKTLDSQNGRVVTKADLESIIPPASQPAAGEKLVVPDQAPDVEVNSDPTMGVSPIEANEGFKALFEDRYLRLLSVMKKRPDTRALGSTSTARGLAWGQKAKVAGLLLNRINRRGSLDLIIDDRVGTMKLGCQDPEVMKAALEAPLDSMVVVEVSKAKSGQLYASSLTLPDIPERRATTSSHRAYAVLLSDLHIGSRMFLQEDFSRFVLWLNGQLGDLDVVSRIRYVVIAGDLIDGVGVYPGQEFQLSERDPKNQYALAAKLLSGIPSHVQIVVSPGNHDPVRQALPQPAVSVEMAEPLYKMENLRWVGDPSYVKLYGVTFLVFHGKSLDDVIATTPGLTYSRPADAMKLLLRARHLAPTYGKRTALSPEQRDFLVIDSVPEVFHAGHVHTFEEQTYRGTLIVNSGTWQAQTSFQANMGLEPTPSVVPVVDLSTLNVVRRNFGATGFEAN